MRTKALVLSALVCAAGAISAVAQNVYSVNVVGYTTVTITNAYVLIGNQLDDGAGNLATNHIPSAPPLTQVFKFNPSVGTYATLSRLPNNTWSGATTMTMAPGEGVFFKKGTAGATPLTLTFVGEVMQGTLVNPVTTGYDIYSAMVPQQGGIQAVHGYVPQNLDQVFKWNPSVGTYATFSYTTAGPTPRWIPSDPVLNVNEAVWIKSVSNKDWSRSFTVN